MKKIIIISVGTFFIGLLLSPVVGMVIGSTRELILGMAPEEAILEIADKIDTDKQEMEQRLLDMQITIDSQQSQLTEYENKVISQDVAIQTQQQEITRTQTEFSKVQLEEKRNAACSEANRLQLEIKDNCGIMPYPGLSECIKSLKKRYKNYTDGSDDQSKEADKEDAKRIKEKLEKVETLKPTYVKASEECGIEVR